MYAIWKYQLQVTGEQTIRVPSDHRFLSVQVQGGVLTIWMAVDTTKPKVDQRILIHGTGHEMPPQTALEAPFLGTVQMHGGQLVWHVFDGGTAS